MRKAGLANGPKTSWTLIIDVGSYTTDCAVIGFDLKDIDRQLDGEVEGLKRRDHVSSPLGIIALDHRIRQIVPDAQSQAIHEMLSDSRPDRIERFHRTLYGESKPYNAGRAGRIGSGTHMEPARECVRTFAEDISRFAEKFIEAGQYPEIDDLILTGGGMMIAAIRDEVTAQLKAMNRLSKLVQIHAHCPERELRRDYHRLTRSLMRGATALGGASVFFDYLGT